MKRILVVNVNWIGDVIFSSPIFRALKDAYPDARVSCLAVPRVEAVLKSIPFIDEVIVFDEKGRHWSLWGKFKLVLDLRRRRFDTAFLLHRSLTRALLVYLAGIPRRVGYDAKGRGKFLTHEVEPLEGQVHRCDYYLNVIESFGVKVQDRRSELVSSAEAEKSVEEMLKANGITDKDKIIIVNPGGNWDLKRWPLESFSCLIHKLRFRCDTKIIITGAKKDFLLFRKISGLGAEVAVNLAGQTSLMELIALMKRADLVISADSGPLHMANSVGTEVVALFGPTRPEITGPRGSGRAHMIQNDVGCNREACYHLTCPDNICMQSITAMEVLEIVEQIRNK